MSEEITNLEDDRVIKRHNSAELQSKLIREGDMMSADELVRLNERKTELDTVLREADDSLKDLYSLIPFGLAGGLMAELSSQLETEKHISRINSNWKGSMIKLMSYLVILRKQRENCLSPLI